MIRLSESFAKMRLDDEVVPENVEAATTLIRTALQEAATDPRTGLINIGMFSAPDMSTSSLESSALRLHEAHGSSPPDLGLDGLFSDPTRHAEDLATLQATLTGLRLDHRTLSQTIRLRNARWSAYD